MQNGAIAESKIRQSRDLERSVDTSVAQLESKMDSYIQALYGARSFLLSSREVNSTEWKQYIENMDLSTRLPGMSAMSYIHRVQSNQSNDLLQKIQSGTPFVPTQFGSDIALYDPESTDKFLVTFIEPNPQNRWKKTLGMDYLSEQERSSALKLAILENKPISSFLIQSADTKNYGFVIMLPIYNPKLPLITSDDKQRAATGAVAIGFRSDYLFSESFKHLIEDEQVKIDVFEGKNTIDKFKMFDSNSAKNVLGTQDPSFSKNSVIFYRETEIAGKYWTIRFEFSSKNMMSAILFTPVNIILFICLCVNILLFLVLHFVYKKKRS